MHTNPHIRMQLASEHAEAVRAEALPRRTRRGFRLGLRRLRILGRRPFDAPQPRAAR